MQDFNRPFETENYPTPDDDRVNVWVKITAVVLVIAAAVMVFIDVQDKVGSWR